MFSNLKISNLSPQCAGLVAIIENKVTLQRTILTGTSSWLDVLVLAPGMHSQLRAPELCGGERPVVGAMTTGYVFRVENACMVKFLQDIGRTGHLTTISVRDEALDGLSTFTRLRKQGVFSMGLYLSCCLLTISVFNQLLIMEDQPGILVLSLFIFARFINVAIIKRRTKQGWKGMPEPGIEGDLLALLTEDRWIRIRGMVDDLKATTSGEWFRRETPFESFLTSGSTFLVYGAAALVGSASRLGAFLIVGLLVVSTGLLGLCNLCTKGLQMYGRQVQVEGEPKPYKRRLDMANELVEEKGRSDWAISMGLIVAPTPQEPIQI